MADTKETENSTTITESLKKSLDDLSFKNQQAQTVRDMQDEKMKLKDRVGRKPQQSYGRIEGLKPLAGLRSRFEPDPKLKQGY